MKCKLLQKTAGIISRILSSNGIVLMMKFIGELESCAQLRILWPAGISHLVRISLGANVV